MEQSFAFSVTEPEHPSLSVVRRCELVPTSRPGFSCQPGTTVPHPAKPLGLRLEHRIWPYLLRDMVADRPDQVWCADIAHLPMRRGFPYCVAVMDWATRKVLSWVTTCMGLFLSKRICPLRSLLARAGLA